MRRRSRLAVLFTGITTVAGGSLALLPTSTEAAANKPHITAPLTVTDMPAGTVSGSGTALAPTLVDPNTTCGPPAADPVPDGQDIMVVIPSGPGFTVGRIPSTWWKAPPYGDAGWQLQMRGFMWVQPLAARAHQDGSTQSLTTLVDQIVAFHAQNHDPGTSTATTTANANGWGWDEGTALRRLGAENCLYSITKDPRLLSAMQEDVNVQYGPRFYGPPRFPVHNHGVMADLTVIRAGDLLGRKDWQTRSINRLVTNAPHAWTTGHVTIEQSSSYHVFNVAFWGEVADMLKAHGAAAATVQRVLGPQGLANRVSPWLTDPDGDLTVVGDAVATPGFVRPTWTLSAFRDDQGGYGIGRWSWKDPLTSYYVIRYGPRRWMHGQEDRAGITWSTFGRRVLVEPGKGIYDVAGVNRAWVRGATSHNVATVDGRTLNTSAAVSRTSSTTSRTSVHVWSTVDQLYGIKHTRSYAIYRSPRRVTVKDTFAGRVRIHQFWHLDPSWTPASRSIDGKRMTFSSGVRTLTVTTTGVAAVLRGVSRPVAGWSSPDGNTRLPAVEIQVRATGTATTTFTVT